MKLKLAVIFLGVFGCFFSHAQEYKISGYIKDVYTNQLTLTLIMVGEFFIVNELFLLTLIIKSNHN
jgi:hypothetical protein